MASATLKKIEKKLDALIGAREKVESRHALMKEKLDAKYKENLEKLNDLYQKKSEDNAKELEKALDEIDPEIAYLRKQAAAVQKLEKSIAAIDDELDRREKGGENEDHM